MGRVLVIDATYDSLDEALDRVFREFPLDVSGKSVLVKPNMLGPFTPERHVNTSPLVVRAVVERLGKAGGRVVVGDNPGARGYGAVEKSARTSGIAEAAGGAWENISGDAVRVRLPGSGLEATVSRRVLESDVLVSVPKFKTHVLTRISGAVKNSYGFVVGGEKTRFHRELPGYQAFAEMLVDVYRIRVPDLVIMDGVTAMEGNGPSSDTLYPAGKILASDNGVSLDAVMATMMGMRPEKIAMLSRARELGLGEIDPDRVTVVGDASRLDKFKRPAPGVGQLVPGKLIQAFYPRLDRPRFKVDPRKCNSCRQCEQICPGGAITLGSGNPEYDYSRCVSCYCCLELCSQQALELDEGLLTRLYRRLGLF